MKIVKWLGGTVLALLALVVGVGAYRSLTALPAPPPMIEEGTLTFAEGVEGTYEAGDLKVVLGGEHGIEVFNKGEEVFKGPKGTPFVWAANGSVEYVGMGDTFLPKVTYTRQCADVLVKAAWAVNGGVSIDTELQCSDGIMLHSFSLEAADEGALNTTSVMDDGPKRHHPDFVAFISDRENRAPVFGGGEQFSHANLDGQFVPLVSAEQGVWRGDQPLTAIVNALLPGITGATYSTYAPAGMAVSQAGSLFWGHPGCGYETYAEINRCERGEGGPPRKLEGAAKFLALDLRAPGQTIYLTENLWPYFIFTGGKPLRAIADLTHTRKMRPLPNWIGEGAILGIQGGTDVVRAKVKAAQDAGVPVAGVWLQDWQGQRRIDNSERLWWNWVLDRERYPAWEKLVADLKAQGIQVMTYINPYLVDVGDELPNRRNLYAEAKAKGYLLTSKDGAVRHIHSGTIEAAVVDLANPEAADWYAGIIIEDLIGTGAMGFMADFGESYPIDPIFIKGELIGNTLIAHNQYPVLWAKTVRQAIDAAPHGDQIVAFHRSGHTDSPRYATAFWAGDQLVNWGQHDGFKSAITAMMTGGISGMAYNHTDIGGYTTVVTPLTNIRRSKELFQRWAEFAAFTPIFRTHEGNQPAMNHQFDSDAETLQHFGKMAKLFQCLHPYRQRLMAEHTATGAPLMRHPWLHYPDDERFHPMTYQQMMLGADIMVVPVSDPGKTHVSAYLPDGGPNEKWEHFWTGKVYAKGDHAVAAPLGEPAFFVRPDSAVKRELAACGL